MHDFIQVNPTSRRSRLSPHPLLVPKQELGLHTMFVPSAAECSLQDLLDPDVWGSERSVLYV